MQGDYTDKQWETINKFLDELPKTIKEAEEKDVDLFRDVVKKAYNKKDPGEVKSKAMPKEEIIYFLNDFINQLRMYEATAEVSLVTNVKRGLKTIISRLEQN